MRCVLIDDIRHKVCPHCDASFMYDQEFNTYNVFDDKGNATLMVECPKCRKSSKDEFSESLMRRINNT